MLSRDLKVIFVHIPKTAGQSIELFFLNKLGLTWETRAPLLLRPNNDPAKGPPRLAHLFAEDYVRLGYITQPEFQSYRRFSVVRNPWDRLVSLYKFTAGRLHHYAFDEFAAQLTERGWGIPTHRATQKQFLCDSQGRLLVDRVLRFETLADDFAALTKELFGTPAALPERNRSTDRRDYRAFYDDKTAALVARAYADDIRLFGYSFDPPARA